tara:strand:- start:252 stop:431 length:180 start_codon:yes stop_codon:yes gene_type:complete
MAEKSKDQISKEQKNRDRVPTDVEEFLAGGGKIKQIDPGVTGEQHKNYGQLYQLTKKPK